ncbi:hypothetical protein BD410DRAFT_855976, partial [Rickenella mellea]
MKLTRTTSPPKLNYRAVDWPEFMKDLDTTLKNLVEPRELTTEDEFYVGLSTSSSVGGSRSVITKHVPLSKPSAYSKRWWSVELKQKRNSTRRLAKRSYRRRSNQLDPAHNIFRIARNEYTEMIRKAKKDHWEEWLESIDDTTIWTANCFVS